MRKISIILCLCFLAIKIQAQNPEDQLGTWYMYNGSHKVSEKFSIKTMAHFRYYELASEFQQAIYRLGANYTLNPKVNFTLGVSYAEADTQYKIPSELLTEFRLYEDINIKTKLSDFKLRHRFRFEHRFIELNDVKSTVNWLRYDLNINYPLSVNWSVYAFNEFFLNFKGDAFAQNWTGAGFLYQLNKNLKLKAGYFHIELPNSGLNRLQLGVILNTNFAKK